MGRIFFNSGRHARKVVRIGFAIPEATEEGLEREAFVLSVGGGKMGYPGAEVVRYLGVTTSAVIRAVCLEKLPELQKYL